MAAVLVSEIDGTAIPPLLVVAAVYVRSDDDGEALRAALYDLDAFAYRHQVQVERETGDEQA